MIDTAIRMDVRIEMYADARTASSGPVSSPNVSVLGPEGPASMDLEPRMIFGTYEWSRRIVPIATGIPRIRIEVTIAAVTSNSLDAFAICGEDVLEEPKICDIEQRQDWGRVILLAIIGFTEK
jgi:hypothetical protein